jgi:hypothetical protein
VDHEPAFDDARLVPRCSFQHSPNIDFGHAPLFHPKLRVTGERQLPIPPFGRKLARTGRPLTVWRLFRMFGMMKRYHARMWRGIRSFMDPLKRRQNERKFGAWTDLPNGGRRYSLDVKGRSGWRAQYVKEVDAEDLTVRFWQEVFDGDGRLREVHEKYPADLGHQKITSEES